MYCVSSGLTLSSNVFKNVNQANVESQPWTSLASDEPEVQNSQSTQGKSCLHQPVPKCKSTCSLSPFLFLCPQFLVRTTWRLPT